MLPLIRIFWDICRLRAGPQAIPRRHNLMIAAVLAGIIIDSFASSILIPKLTGLDILKIVTIYNILLLTAIYLLLKIIGYADRGVQTVTAIAGSGLFISLVLLPGLLMMNTVEEQVKSFAIFILIDNVWRIAVVAHIFRHAFSINLLMAMILSVSYLIFGVFVADFLLPA
jgi:flagellar biosynthesis protein FliQ